MTSAHSANHSVCCIGTAHNTHWLRFKHRLASISLKLRNVERLYRLVYWMFSTSRSIRATTTIPNILSMFVHCTLCRMIRISNVSNAPERFACTLNPFIAIIIIVIYYNCHQLYYRTISTFEAHKKSVAAYHKHTIVTAHRASECL